MNNTSQQSGQAMLELTAMLVGLIAMTLGIIFVAGLSLADNKTLLSAKSGAEMAAHNDAGPKAGLVELSGWSYSGADSSLGEKIVIPFSAHDYSVRNRLGSSLDGVDAVFESVSYSSSDANYLYRWYSPRSFDTNLDGDFSGDLTNAFDAAKLIQASGSYAIDPVSNFDAGYKTNAREPMRNAFHEWFGIRIRENRLLNSPANQVYIPLAQKDQ
ncbi:MAG: hypothetical protein LBM70_01040 [Victivallales bacterium]|jgi:hypothetical protein|nr:hypothetical protein [Victivallales bacterium]